ncbi:type II secretion system F family protein [Novosphingobium pentaromativorans]|uniref:Tight adherence protein B n=1 Tax=Novosphingobium pentaromativorans US6-1 TaxID=1088721 RepID=G6EIU4_9SPHN|nr:type II secretion system F family protein [Novosphingobium pentaromativorans]AIT78907.1 secretion system protein [Novosphingobium pentaromativorans US6-1]EHJ58703.1 tight adherence protein B [Novosphingobium pentaromativorans US6-1]
MTGLFVRLFVLIAAFVAVFLISQTFLRFFWDRRSERSGINERLRMLRAGLSRETVAYNLLKNAPPHLSAHAGWIERKYVNFIRMVMMAAIRTDAKQILLRMVIAFFASLGLLLLVLFVLRITITLGVVQLVVVLCLGATIALPILLISRKAEQRRKRMEEQFPVALDIFSRSLRSGHPIASAVGIITEEMPDPVGTEFGLVSDEVAYGAELNDAFAAMAERWDLEDIRMFVVCVSVQSETGGNLAEILDNLSKVIRERAALYLKVRALSSEGRMTGWMLTVLPVFTLLSMFLVNPKFYLDVAQDPIFVVGFPALFVLYCVGVYAIRRLTDLKV